MAPTLLAPKGRRRAAATIAARLTLEKVTRRFGRVAALQDIDLDVQPGEILVLRSRGMPVLQGFGRGDQRVLVNVRVPRRLTEEQRDLLERLEGTVEEEQYRDDEGFFDKLKSAFR